MAYGSSLSGTSPGEINGLPKKVEYIGIKDLPSIQFRDDTPFSDNYFNIVEFPDTLTSGKNLFKLKASSRGLIKDTQIHLEVLDSNGDPIYYEPLDYFERDGTRVVTIHVTANTPPGRARVFLAARINEDPETGESIPYNKDWNSPDYINIPNLLWSRSITVAPNELNKSEIIFTEAPRLRVAEATVPYSQPTNIFNITKTKLADGITFDIREVTANQLVQTVEFNSFTQQNVIVESFEERLVTGYSRMEASAGFFSASMVGSVITVQNPRFVYEVINDRGFFADAASNILPVAQLTSTYPGPDLLDFLGSRNNTGSAANPGGGIHGNGVHQLSGSIGFIIQDVLSSTEANIVQISGLNENPNSSGVSGNSNGSFVVEVFLADDWSSATGGPASADGLIIRQWIGSPNVTASYIQPFETIMTAQTQSFAQITISDLEPKSGDVYKIRTLYKPGGMFGDFIDAGETIVEQVELLEDTASFEGTAAAGAFYNRIGVFDSVNDFETYFTQSLKHANHTPVILTPTLAADKLMGGIKLSPADNILPSASKNFASIHLKDKYLPTVQAGTRYTLEFKLLNIQDTDTVEYSDTFGWYGFELLNYIDRPHFQVYISGSKGSIIPDPETKNEYWDQTRLDDWSNSVTYGNTIRAIDVMTGFNIGSFNRNGNHPGGGVRYHAQLPNFGTGAPIFDGHPMGTRIAHIEANSPGEIQSISLNFTAKKTEPIDLSFVPFRGEWIIADVTIRTLKETGYTPNLAQINVRIPTQFKNTPLSFKFQYLDYLGRQADLESVAYPVIFNGDNTVIDGEFNLLSGSLFISNQIGSGLELAGAQSGFLRSIGYQSFQSASRTDQPGGFLMYSGSVLPNAPDNYQGVGLELVRDSASFFRFKTDGADAGLEIQTDKFFLGSETSQFISGSGGIFEISATNFTLSPEGNVTGSNMLLTGNARADILEYRNLTIDASNSGSYLNAYTYGGRDYYELDLSNDAAMFVRLDFSSDDILYPIAKINIPSGDIETRAQTVYIESADTNGIPIVALSQGSSDIDINIDSGDLLDNSFTTRTWNGTSYVNMYVLPHGCRMMCVRSKFDWKIQSLSDYSTATASFGAINISNNFSASNVSAETMVIGSTLTHMGDSNTKITFSDDDINLTVAGKTAIDLTWDGTGGGDTREITFNESHADFDVRIEGDTDVNLLFTDAGNDKVGIGTNSPDTKLHVNGTISASGYLGPVDGGSF